MNYKTSFRIYVWMINVLIEDLPVLMYHTDKMLFITEGGHARLVNIHHPWSMSTLKRINPCFYQIGLTAWNYIYFLKIVKSAKYLQKKVRLKNACIDIFRALIYNNGYFFLSHKILNSLFFRSGHIQCVIVCM